MLYDLLKSGYGNEEDLNCAEKILYGANKAYKLGLEKEALKLAVGFGGGMAIESVCGALTASIMVLGRLFVQSNVHESARIKELIKELFDSYKKEMGYIECAPLKEKYRKENILCRDVILKAAEILDTIVEKEPKL